jgi:hypothetical protein
MMLHVSQFVAFNPHFLYSLYQENKLVSATLGKYLYFHGGIVRNLVLVLFFMTNLIVFISKISLV